MMALYCVKETVNHRFIISIGLVAGEDLFI